MNRRNAIATAFASAAALTAQSRMNADETIQLHLDLTVDPAKEKELRKNFKEIFKPAMAKQPGFLHVYMLKLRQVMQGKLPEGANYRLVINFKSEADRLNWVKTNDHQAAWPTIENTLKAKNYSVILYDQL